MNFTELNLHKPILDAIKKAGYETPSEIQEKAIPEVMKGRDLIACAQTGTGKTAAFALPVLHILPMEKPLKIRALVVTPTRELAIQIFDNFKKYGRYMQHRVACCYGGVGQGPQIAAIKRGCDILVATPGRLQDYMNQGVVSLENVQILILDEADRMLDMGFIHDIRRIAAAVPADHQTLMFSATMPREIERLALDLLKDPERIEAAPQATPADTVSQKICFLDRADKKLALGEFLQEEDVEKSIVFTRTKHGADHLSRDLKKGGVETAVIHGDRSQGQRQHALELFRSGKVKVLVATDVAARGIDIPRISHVFNYDLPEESESYIHRIGRAGRAGETGVAISLCSPEEMNLLKDIEKMMKKEIDEIQTQWTVAVTRKKASRPSQGGSRGAGAGTKGRKNNGYGRKQGASSSRNSSKNMGRRNREDTKNNGSSRKNGAGSRSYRGRNNNSGRQAS